MSNHKDCAQDACDLMVLISACKQHLKEPLDKYWLKDLEKEVQRIDKRKRAELSKYISYGPVEPRGW